MKWLEYRLNPTIQNFLPHQKFLFTSPDQLANQFGKKWSPETRNHEYSCWKDQNTRCFYELDFGNYHFLVQFSGVGEREVEIRH